MEELVYSNEYEDVTMEVFIQGVEARQESIDRILQELPDAKVSIDKDLCGPLFNLKQILAHPIKDYRLILQDDVILSDRLKPRLPALEVFMKNHSIDLLSLFVPPRKKMEAMYKEGEDRIIKFDGRFLWAPAVIYSPRLLYILRNFKSKETFHDDSFVGEACAVNKITPYCHVPSLVQHDIEIPSSLGHANSVNRTTKLFK